MAEYLIRVEMADDSKFNMQVVVKVIKQVLEASGARIVQWGKKEEMLKAMVIDNGDEDKVCPHGYSNWDDCPVCRH